MSNKLELVELVLMINRNWTLSPYAIDELASDLGRVAKKAARLAIWQCNEPEPSEGYFERQEALLDRRMEKIKREHDLTGLTWDITGDPRGYCLKLHTPNGDHNTWGGKESGWGVA